MSTPTERRYRREARYSKQLRVTVEPATAAPALRHATERARNGPALLLSKYLTASGCFVRFGPAGNPEIAPRLDPFTELHQGRITDEVHGEGLKGQEVNLRAGLL